ncbi:hypothetical protein AQUCO_00200898v1 [Aquilegia coerulea]|uniref:phosphoserine phosphatase n=1 Tax=Aquilegia coerulea TaxID=218851 RepID=A0A2G5F5N2_AQUCA|nr:hypothetical protein AQUCO_00200898v1 [Aquilegia coerulea]
MEGLISARTINPIRSQSCSNRFLQSPLFPEVAHCTTQKLYNYPVKLMTQFKSIAPMTTSAQSTDSITPAHLNNTLPSKDVLEIWRNADAVCFDVDSTVCLDEGIDELAEFCGAGKAVAEWTVRISPGIDELITKLKANNTDVYLVSGGFRQMIQVLFFSSSSGLPLIFLPTVDLFLHEYNIDLTLVLIIECNLR